MICGKKDFVQKCDDESQIDEPIRERSITNFVRIMNLQFDHDDVHGGVALYAYGANVCVHYVEPEDFRAPHDHRQNMMSMTNNHLMRNY